MRILQYDIEAIIISVLVSTRLLNIQNKYSGKNQVLNGQLHVNWRTFGKYKDKQTTVTNRDVTEEGVFLNARLN